MRVEIAYVAPGIELLRALDTPAGTTVEAAVCAAGLADMVNDDIVFAIFGRRVTRDTLVVDGDRIEITRPLVCDPKSVRRERARKRNRD